MTLNNKNKQNLTGNGSKIKKRLSFQTTSNKSLGRTPPAIIDLVKTFRDNKRHIFLKYCCSGKMLTNSRNRAFVDECWLFPYKETNNIAIHLPSIRSPVRCLYGSLSLFFKKICLVRENITRPSTHFLCHKSLSCIYIYVEFYSVSLIFSRKSMEMSAYKLINNTKCILNDIHIECGIVRLL